MVGLGVLALAGAGCAAMIGGVANDRPKNINEIEQRDTEAVHVFATNFSKVEAGRALTGKGGMTFAQVRGILGRPKAGNVTPSKSGGGTVTPGPTSSRSRPDP